MRSAWFKYVQTIRKRNSTKKKPCSHRQAMSLASQTWGKEKLKIERRIKRESKQKSKNAPENQLDVVLPEST